jgi:soluble lytic murein transglycosylase
MQFIKKLLTIALFVGFSTQFSFAQENEFKTDKLWKKFTKNDIETLRNINSALAKNNFDEAMNLVKVLKSNIGNEKNSLADAIVDIILWNKYSGKIDSKKTSFNDISTFVIDNPYLPNINDLRRNVERVAIANNVDYKIAEAYFNSNPALTTESKLYVVESKILKIATEKTDQEVRDSQSKTIQSEIAKIWIKENFSVDSERQFIEKYKDILTENDHSQRIERLLWEGKKIEAARIMNYVGKDYRNLFESIAKIEESPRYIDNLLLDIPRRLRANELLSFKRLIWYKSKDRIDDVIDLLIDLPENYKLPEKWWSFRRLYGREMIKQKQFKKAYQILSKHNLSVTSNDFWEAEWTAGWVALRFLDEPKDALIHFQKMHKNVVQPVTLSRAIYWEAMCYEAMNQKSKAIELYKAGTNYPIFFYGQLAIHKHKNLDPLGSEKDIILPKSPDITGRDIVKISESRAAQIAYILAISGDRDNASKIFEWLVNNAPTEGQIAVIMKIVGEIGDRQLDAKISRIASKKNVFFVREKFQIVKEVMNDEFAPLVHAIIKQESGFAQMAVSHVGALGFMQLMPGTAKLVAKELGVKYDQKKLTHDIQYNVRLGSFYIKKLIDEFNGSEMLAIASYNAGPNATKRWINEFYDPRLEKDYNKIVDWIELITYSETRNYVQRIIENMIVYKYLMSRNNYDQLQ